MERSNEELNRVLKELNGNSTKASTPLSAKTVDVDKVLSTTPNKKDDSLTDALKFDRKLTPVKNPMEPEEAPKDVQTIIQPSTIPKNVFQFNSVALPQTIEHQQQVNYSFGYEPMDVDESFEECSPYYFNETVRLGAQQVELNDLKLLENNMEKSSTESTTLDTSPVADNNTNESVLLCEAANFTIVSNDTSINEVDPLSLGGNDSVPGNVSFDFSTFFSGFDKNLFERQQENVQDIPLKDNAAKAELQADIKAEEAIATITDNLNVAQQKPKQLQRILDNMGRNSPDIFYSPPNTPDRKVHLPLEQQNTPDLKTRCEKELIANSENLNESFGTDGYSTPMEQPTTPNPKLNVTQNNTNKANITIEQIPAEDGNLTLHIEPSKDELNETANETVLEFGNRTVDRIDMEWAENMGLAENENNLNIQAVEDEVVTMSTSAAANMQSIDINKEAVIEQPALQNIQLPSHKVPATGNLTLHIEPSKDELIETANKTVLEFGNCTVDRIDMDLAENNLNIKAVEDCTADMQPTVVGDIQTKEPEANIKTMASTTEAEIAETPAYLNITAKFEAEQNETDNNSPTSIIFPHKQVDNSKQQPAMLPDGTVTLMAPTAQDSNRRRTFNIIKETNPPTEYPSIVLTDTDTDAADTQMHERRTFTLSNNLANTTFTMPNTPVAETEKKPINDDNLIPVTPITQTHPNNSDTNRRRTFVVPTTPNATSKDDPLFKMPFETPIKPKITPAEELSEVAASKERKDKRRTFNIALPEDEFALKASTIPVMNFTVQRPAAGGFPVNEKMSSHNFSAFKSKTQASNSNFPVNDFKSSNFEPPMHKLPIQDHLKFPDHTAENIFKQPAKVDFFKKTLGNQDLAFNQHADALDGNAAGMYDTDEQVEGVSDANFGMNNNLFLNPADFDYLLTKGNNEVNINRSSLLLKFDPILGKAVPANTLTTTTSATPSEATSSAATTSAAKIDNNQQLKSLKRLSPTVELEEHSNNSSIVTKEDSFQTLDSTKQSATLQDIFIEQQATKEKPIYSITVKKQGKEQQKVIQKNNAKMSVDLIKDINADSDCKKSYENSNSHSNELQNNIKMDEFEKKIKNDVLKGDIEKKLNDAEQREEALIKRITEKDKKISKLNDVIAAYEKAIAELIAEKETLIQSHEKQITEVKADRDSNYYHLTSLETTFSDLHVKYEKSKEMTLQLKANEDTLVGEKRQLAENLRLQEQRYDKMKNHAAQQLEIANKKIESQSREHTVEITKLRALLKKEEISRASMTEQLQQKSRENEELVKICDELINGQGS